MSYTRRGFFQFLTRAAGTLGVTWLAVRTASSHMYRRVLPARSVAPENRKWVMVVDLAKCDGCRDCTKACTKMHFVPPQQEWIKVYEVTGNGAAGSYFLPR